MAAADKPNDEPKSTPAKERKHVPGKVMPFLARELFATLSPGAWKVWTVMFLHANRENYSFLANNTLRRESGLARNTVRRAKRELVKKKWVDNCGQRGGWQSNLYKVSIPMPKPVEKFIGALWIKLNKESWWEVVGEDKHNYAEDHLDWLTGWRVVCVLKRSGWRGKTIGHKVWTAAEGELLRILRSAAKDLDQGRGLWWLWGRGFDEAATELSGNTPGPK